jgi:LacI family transcriptional regulator
MDDLSRFCCQNSACPDRGKRGQRNLSVCGRYGPGKQRHLLRCGTCTSRFSEPKGTIFFGATLPQQQIASVMEHIGQDCGVAKTSRLVGVHRHTVTPYGMLTGEHAQDLHGELVVFFPRDTRGPA